MKQNRSSVNDIGIYNSDEMGILYWVKRLKRTSQLIERIYTLYYDISKTKDQRGDRSERRSYVGESV